MNGTGVDNVELLKKKTTKKPLFCVHLAQRQECGGPKCGTALSVLCASSDHDNSSEGSARLNLDVFGTAVQEVSSCQGGTENDALFDSNNALAFFLFFSFAGVSDSFCQCFPADFP